MPAIDALISGGAIHISDQNKHKAIKTLCGQALDKENTRYLENRDNFEQSTCKVCRSIYFDETWKGEAREEPKEVLAETPQEEDQVIREDNIPVRLNLFGGLTKPVNVHKDPLDRNEQTIGENQDGS